MNKAQDLKVIGVVSGGDKQSVASAGPTLPFRKQKWPNFESVGNNDPHKNVQAFVVWLTLIAQQRQTTSW